EALQIDRRLDTAGITRHRDGFECPYQLLVFALLFPGVTAGGGLRLRCGLAGARILLSRIGVRPAKRDDSQRRQRCDENLAFETHDRSAPIPLPRPPVIDSPAAHSASARKSDGESW